MGKFNHNYFRTPGPCYKANKREISPNRHIYPILIIVLSLLGCEPLTHQEDVKGISQ
jgi:hypothetical protein